MGRARTVVRGRPISRLTGRSSPAYRFQRISRQLRVRRQNALSVGLFALAVSFAASACNGRGTTAISGPTPDFRAEPFLDTVEIRTFQWFWDNTNPTNGLVPDRWTTKSFSSVAAIGFEGLGDRKSTRL